MGEHDWIYFVKVLYLNKGVEIKENSWLILPSFSVAGALLVIDTSGSLLTPPVGGKALSVSQHITGKARLKPITSDCRVDMES